MYLLQYLPWYVLILVGLFIMIYVPYWIRFHSTALTKQQKVLSSGLGILLGISIVKINLIEGLITFHIIDDYDSLFNNEAVDNVVFASIVISTILLIITVGIKVISYEQSIQNKIKQGILFTLAIIALIWISILKYYYI